MHIGKIVGEPTFMGKTLNDIVQSSVLYSVIITLNDTLSSDEGIAKLSVSIFNSFHVSLSKYWVLFGKRKHFVLLKLISFSPKHSDPSSHSVLLRMSGDEPSVNVSHPTALYNDYILFYKIFFRRIHSFVFHGSLVLKYCYYNIIGWG